MAFVTCSVQHAMHHDRSGGILRGIEGVLRTSSISSSIVCGTARHCRFPRRRPHRRKNEKHVDHNAPVEISGKTWGQPKFLSGLAPIGTFPRPKGATHVSQGWSAAEPLVARQITPLRPNGATQDCLATLWRRRTFFRLTRGSAALHPWLTCLATLWRRDSYQIAALPADSWKTSPEGRGFHHSRLTSSTEKEVRRICNSALR